MFKKYLWKINTLNTNSPVKYFNIPRSECILQCYDALNKGVSGPEPFIINLNPYCLAVKFC